MYAKIQLKKLLQAAISKLGLSWPEKANIEPPRDLKFGDLACNVAMMLSKEAGKNPRQLAQEIKEILSNLESPLEKIEIAGPGFLNFTFKKFYWLEIINTIAEQKDRYGASTFGKGAKVQIEYVSANPTGPLHIGHGRGAAVGDSLTRIMRFAGYDVSTEYYLNDAGIQMNILGESTWIRYQNLCGVKASLEEHHYQGEYLIETARQVFEEHGRALLDMDLDHGISICRKMAMDVILNGIKEDLNLFRVEHQHWFSELSLIQKDKVSYTLEWLQDKDLAYEKDDALWFKSTDFGDDKDRVLKKSDGSLTYFASDIAYHQNKFDRGFELAVDIWGADHHGYVPRMKAAVQALGKTENSLQVILVQLVNLQREGHQIAMSTRAGKFVTLKDVIQEVGIDACRFIFLSRKSDSHLDFDLEVVKRKTMDNPVYYVQYAHARICSLFAKAQEMGITPPTDDTLVLNGLDTPEDIELLKKLHDFPETVSSSATNLSPHYISFYLMDLAGCLHKYYTVHSVLKAESSELIQARMTLFQAVARVIRNGLNLLGVYAPEKM
ncbi:arginine--tRNA ligase [Desulfonatronovibrio magnus]|uniref:arginine--tRNA ligase n=1 Tax=Desulfonatronovibrio magnus TaxID=698827 RepID=UPI0005EB769C|nr:arginine--tRNA ligase [Desulfonatronovibrio magnus]